MYEINNWYKGKSTRKRLRKGQTKAEQKLWSKLRRKQLGYKFRRQHGFDRYIIDFYCSELLLAIEVDGNIHDNKIQREYDRIRQEYLESFFIKVLRFRNEQVLFEIESALAVIKYECEERELYFSSLTPSDSPLAGGELD